MLPSFSLACLPEPSALGEVQALLKRYIDIKDKASEMYKKNLSLALLETTFRLPAALLNPNHDNMGLSPRVVQIGLFLDQYFERLSAFDDVKSYVAELGFDEIKNLMEDVLPKILDEVGTQFPSYDTLTDPFRTPESRGRLYSKPWSASSDTSSPHARRHSRPSPLSSMARPKANLSSAGFATTRRRFPASAV